MSISFSSKIYLSGSVALMLLLTGCGPSKVAQCNDFIAVSNELGTRGETFGTELEAELQQKMTSLGGNGGPPDFAAISSDLGAAADTIETKAGQFLDESNTKLSAVELKDETLKGYQAEYVALIGTMGTKIDAMAQAVRDMGTIIGQIDPKNLTNSAQIEKLQADMGQAEAAINTSIQGLNEVETQEDKIVEQINTYCGAKPAE